LPAARREHARTVGIGADVDVQIDRQPAAARDAAWPRLLVALACAVALAIVMSGYGVRLGWWDYRVGFRILGIAPYAALAIGAVALVALVVPFRGAQNGRALAVAFVVGAVMGIAPLAWARILSEGPPINDITTDTADPPQFEAVVPLRGQSTVSVAYPGEATAAQQRSGYPDLHAAVVAAAPAAALDAALAAARRMGWQIVASDARAGRIEATDTTPWFGFKDDIVVRVRPDGQGSRIDVRSLSRVGRGDLGVNARRIRRYVAKLAP
jgi:hypothetical protein